MSVLNVTRSYSDGNILTEAMLDAFLDDIEALVNTTGFDQANLNSNSVGNAQLQDNAVTAVELDETDDYEMETLQLGDNAGPILSKDAANRLRVNNSVILGSTAGPILSKSGTEDLGLDGDLVIAAGHNIVLDSITLADVSGVLRFASIDTIQIGTSGARLQADGDSVLLRNDSGTAQGGLVVGPASAGVGHRIQSGTGAGDGDTEVTVTFSTAFSSAPTVVMNFTESHTVNAYIGTITAANFTVNFNGVSTDTFNWIAVGRYT